ncbi:MAG: PD-(D/E)XK nuclease family protein [Lachnospiraceae bacterium]|nr:PD-(D/E)XK nuclease family protein [Lachnospiraceae bacterium]
MIVIDYKLCVNCSYEINNEEALCSNCGQPMHSDCVQQCVNCGKYLCDLCASKLKWKCNDCVVDIYSMDFISSTMFEAYLKCPFMFKELFVVNKNVEMPNKWSRIGQELHSLFDKWSYKDDKNSKTMITEFIQQYQTINKDLFDNEEDYTNFFDTSCKSIRNWIKSEEQYSKPLYTEKQHFVKLHDDLPQVRVTIDRINGDEGNASEWDVQDYKTGRVYTAEQLRENIQLPTYAMAIKTIYGALPKYLRLRFTQHNKERLYVRLDDDTYECKVPRGGTYTISLNKTLDKMVDIYSNIKKDSFKPNISNIYFCDNFCPLMKEGKCSSLNTKWRLLNQRGY